MIIIIEMCETTSGFFDGRGGKDEKTKIFNPCPDISI